MSSACRQRRRHAVGVLLIAVVLGGCTTTSHRRPSSPSVTPTTTPAPTIQAGTLGQLSPPPHGHNAGPRLTLPHPPKGLLLMPGSYPLGSQVRFQIPIRNDGNRAVRIERLDAG